MPKPASAASGRVLHIVGRTPERGVLERFLQAVRSGESQPLLVLGEPGIGKTALLEELADQASDCRLVSVSGVESEMELAFAALHQLCAPLLDRLDAVPEPQALALRTTFGMTSGPVPDRFLVGLAVLGLLAEAAAEQPLLCLVDDEQWLDRASAQVMAFVARRLGAESLGLIFAARTVSTELRGLPQLTIEGLGKADACALLDSVLTTTVDARVRDQIIAETHGNPLALVELPHELAAAQLAGGFGLPGAVAVPRSAEEMFWRRSRSLPPDARRLLLLAAAEPTGDPSLLWRAAESLRIGPAAAGPAAEAGLVEFGARVRFRHPLVRSAAYQSASAEERHEAHAALAAATDPAVDPDRRAWHRAQAAEGPDEDVAAELERSAERAPARGGLAAAAAFLERATILTPDPAQRTQRALAGAQAKVAAGDFDAALDLLAMAEGSQLVEAEQARAQLVRAHLAFAASRDNTVSGLMLEAAKRLEPCDPGLARATYLDAIYAAMHAGRLADPRADVFAAARAAHCAPPPPGVPNAGDHLLDGIAAMFNESRERGMPALNRALTTFGGDMPAEREMRWLSVASMAAPAVWDDRQWELITDRNVRLCRRLGALTELPLALASRAFLLLFAGELSAASSLIDELQAAASATGSNVAAYGTIGLAAFRGRESEVASQAQAIAEEAAERGEGLRITVSGWATAVVNNGLGHYRKALAAALRASEYEQDLSVRNWALAELVEAAARSGASETAAAAYRQLAEIAEESGTDWALGVQSRSHALLTAGPEADGRYHESIARLDRVRVRSELARARLLYGEWLRRERRRSEARTQLRDAQAMFDEMGMTAFAERARRELWATGEAGRKRSADSHGELTAQESQIAKLAGEGLTNPEIGTRLFISARTVEYHLSKVFGKLGVTARSQLSRVLTSGTGELA